MIYAINENSIKIQYSNKVQERNREQGSRRFKQKLVVLRERNRNASSNAKEEL